MLTMSQDALTVTEKTQLDALEQVIERGRATFIEVGNALLKIRDSRLYRAEFETFEDYCQARWGWTHRHANQLIAASNVVSLLQDGKSISQIPTATQAIHLAKLEPAQVVNLVKEIDLDKTSVRELAKIVQEKKTETIRENRAARIAEIVQQNAPMSKELGTFNVIYADPPWQYDYSPTESRAIENQYPTMPLEDICALPVEKIAADDCVLFLWATNPKLEEALTVIRAWGFTYKTNMVWVKDKIGMGYYARQQHELLLIATRGSLPVPEPSARPSSVIQAERSTHSAKPESVYDTLERMYPDFNKVELFCRTPREGWTAWGNQSH